MPRTGITAAKAARIAHDEVRLLGTDRCALGICDPPVGVHCGDLASKRQGRRGFGVDGPGVEQVKVARCDSCGRHVRLVWQAGCGVFGRETRDVVGGPDGLLDRRAREVGCAGIAPALAGVDRDTQRLVAIALDILQLTDAHRYRQTHTFGDFGSGITCAEAPRDGQGVIDSLLELCDRVGETGRSCHVRCNGC